MLLLDHTLSNYKKWISFVANVVDRLARLLKQVDLHPALDPVKLSVVKLVKNWESADLKQVFDERADEAFFFKLEFDRVFTVVMHFEEDAILLAGVE